MIPVVYFECGTFYTVITETQVIRGKFTGSEFGKLIFSGSNTYNIALTEKEYFETIRIGFTDIIAVGQCSESRYNARNELCWILNDESI